MNKSDLKRINKAAIAKMQDCVSELKKQIPGKTVLEKSRIIARKSQLELQINAALMTDAHLQAGEVIVDLNEEAVAALDEIAQRIDTKIVKGLKLDALLQTIPELIEASGDLSTIVGQHTASA